MRSVRLFAVVILVLVLALSSAQSALASVKLYYDNGILGGTGGAFSHAGVRFSLPSDVNEAHLLDIQFAWAAGGVLSIYVTDSSHEILLGPIPVATTAWMWNTVDVSGSSVVVDGDFWVVIQRSVTATSSLEFDNGANVEHRSCIGGSLVLTSCNVGWNWMIRVDIDPIIQPVGGFMQPVSKIAVVAPYLALLGVIGLVTCVSTVVVVTRRKK